MKNKGILLALSSLPTNIGVGDFGISAKRFIRLLNKYKFNVWQILPLNPLSYGHSPYQPFSSYAFDEIYISLNILYQKKLIKKLPRRYKQTSKVYFEKVRKRKEKYYREAYKNFKKSTYNRNKLTKFKDNNPRIYEFAKFITLHNANNDLEWSKWKDFDLESKIDEINYHLFLQYELNKEWESLHKYAKKHNVTIIGDLPFYAGYDSSDVYFHKDAFKLDEFGKPIVVAGVAPDYFSISGQRWGNPIYDFDHLKESNYEFLIDRIIFASKIYDIVRLDHFRAFDTHYEIPASEETAINGEWILTDGYGILDNLFKKAPNIALIAEDLGDLRDEVYTLRDYYNLPGMNVLQFTFKDIYILKTMDEVPYNSVTYLGTHDNKTLCSWISSLSKKDKAEMNVFFLKNPEFIGESLKEKMLQFALKQHSKYVIFLTQDILLQKGCHQINEPSTINNRNWTYRLTSLKRLGNAIKWRKLD